MQKYIFLVDDDEDEFEIFTDVLKEIGLLLFKCTHVITPELALQKLSMREGIPDYIFLDLNMPRINGLNCLTEIRKMPHLDHSKVIIYSNGVNEDICNRAITLGAHACIKKPASITVFAEELKKILS